jgi:hypothetical protein
MEEEEEEREPRKEEDTANDYEDVPAEAVIEWLSLSEFSNIPVLLTVHGENEYELGVLHETIVIFNAAVRICERMLVRGMDVPDDLRTALDKASYEDSIADIPRFMVFDIRRGSLVVEGSLAIALVAIFKVVIGRPASEAWKSSKTRKRLVKALRDAIDAAGDTVAQLLVDVARSRKILSSIEVDVRKEPHPSIKAELRLKPKRQTKKRNPARRPDSR